MKKLQAVTLAIAATLVLSACGGHGGTLPAGTSRDTAAMERVSLSIPIPRKTAISPKYVSPATQSAGVVITPGGGSALAVQTVNCTSTSCSGTINAPVGSDTFAVSLYSGAGATGSVLSAATLTQTIVAGKANTVTLAFDGVPASVALTLSSSSYTVGTGGSITISATAKDASGNTIIGTYLNPITLTNSDSSGASSLSTSSLTSSSSTAALTYNATFDGATITASASGCTSVSGSITASGGGSTPVQYLTQKSATLVDGAVSSGSTSAIVATLSGAADPAVGATAYWNLDTLSVGSGSSAQSIGRRASASLKAPVRRLQLPRYRPAPEMHTTAADAQVERLMRTAMHAPRTASSSRKLDSVIPASLTVGSSTANIWVSVFSIGSSSGSYQQVPSTLEAQTAHGNIWIDSSLLTGGTAPSQSFNSTNLSATMSQLGTDFENAYASDTAHFASADYSASAPGATETTSYCNSSGTQTGTGPLFIAEPADKRIDVLVLNTANLGAGVGGYFSSLNYMPQSAVNCYGGGYESNEAPIFFVGWEDANGGTYELQEDLVRGMAHEFQHEINFVNHGIVNPSVDTEDSFINEGLSMLAQDLAVDTMFGSQGVHHDAMDALMHAQEYLANPSSYSVTGFTGIDPSSGAIWTGNGSPAYNCGGGCYGSAFLAQRYFYDRCGGDAYSQAMETGGVVGGANIVAACKSSETFGQLMSDFGTAMAASTLGVSSSDARFVFGLNLFGTYPAQAGFSSTVLSGVNVTQLGANASGSQQVPIGGFGFTQLTSIPAAGESASITDTATVSGFGLAGAVIQQ